MTAQGPNSAGLIVTYAVSGSAGTWGSIFGGTVDELYVSDDTYAVPQGLSSPGDFSDPVRLSAFAFSIPGDATDICVTVEVEAVRSLSDADVYVAASSGLIVGGDETDRLATYGISGYISDTEGYVTAGGAADDGGHSYTPAEVNSSDFFIDFYLVYDAGSLASGISADHARVTITYTTPGGGGQTLTPSLFTNSQTYYGPTVTRGTVTLTPSLFTNSQAFYAPTVTRGTVTLTPALFTNAQSFFAPTVTRGAVTLSPSLFTNSQTFYAPTVAPGAVTLAASLVTNAQTFYAPTVTSGALTLVPSLFTNTQAFYGPAVTGAITLLPSLFANDNAFYGATVTQDASQTNLHGKRRLNTWGRGKRVIYPDEIDPPCIEPECKPEPAPEPEPPFIPIDPAPIVAEAIEASGATVTRLVTESRQARKARETQIAAEKAAHRARLAQDDEYLLLSA